MDTLPNLAGVATSDLVEKIGGSGFQASYINWSRTLHLLRQEAPGWLPAMVEAPDGGIVHKAPVGAFLLIYFRHLDGTETPPVPQAIMDSRNGAIPVEKITARDITDTHRRGVCMAAALTFGLAYELWAKMPLESGYVKDEDNPVGNASPMSGVAESLTDDERAMLERYAVKAREWLDTDQVEKAVAYLEEQTITTEGKAYLWSLFDSKQRSAMKKVKA